MPALPGPALGVLELESLARGVVVADALHKRAEVSLAVSEPVTPGKWLLVFSGPVAEVEEAFGAGVAAAGPTLLDSLMLPYVHERVVDVLEDRGDPRSLGDAVGLVETQTAASALRAADTALKRADVALERMQLSVGIGGKGLLTLRGSQDMVEAALAAVAEAVQRPLLLATELIAQPAPALKVGRTLLKRGPGLPR